MAKMQLAFDILVGKNEAPREFDRTARAADRVSKAGNIAGKVLKTSIFAGAAVAGVGLAGLAKVLHTGIGELKDYEGGLAQLKAGIKSTGNAARVDAKGLEALASSIQDYSGQTDDSIVASEQLLLTFTKVRNEVGKGNDIFNQATKATADMAARLGGDASSSAIQLGKALNDPVKGVTALSKVGVSFDAQQKKHIKTYVKAGNVLAAQKIILAELNKEFGGSAKAVGDSLPGQIEKGKRAFEDLSQSVVGAFAPLASQYLPKVTAGLKDLTPVITHVAEDGAKKVAKFIDEFSKGVGTGGDVRKTFIDIGRVLRDDVAPALATAGGYVKTAFGFVADHPKLFSQIAKDAVIIGAALKGKSILEGVLGKKLPGIGALASKAAPMPVFVTNPGFGAPGVPGVPGAPNSKGKMPLLPGPLPIIVGSAAILGIQELLSERARTMTLKRELDALHLKANASMKELRSAIAAGKAIAARDKVTQTGPGKFLIDPKIPADVRIQGLKALQVVAELKVRLQQLKNRDDPEYQRLLRQNAQTASAAAHKLVSDLHAQGKLGAGALAKGLASGKGQASGAAKSLAASAKAAANLGPGFTALGASAAQGYAAGFRGSMGGVIGSIRAGIAAAIAAARSVQDSRSPSRVYAKLGDQAMQGYAVGVDRSAKHASAATAKAVAAAAKKSAAAVVENLRKSIEAQKALSASDERAIESTQRRVDSIRTLADSYAEYGRSIADASKSFSNPLAAFGNLGETPTLSGLISSLQDKESTQARFAFELSGLSKKGVSKSLIEQLYQAGPDSIGLVDQLFNASSAEIGQLNSVMGSLDFQARALGDLGVGQKFGSNAAEKAAWELHNQTAILRTQESHLRSINHNIAVLDKKLAAVLNGTASSASRQGKNRTAR